MHAPNFNAVLQCPLWLDDDDDEEEKSQNNHTQKKVILLGKFICTQYSNLTWICMYVCVLLGICVIYLL